jgi:hypothetical protein
MKSIQDGDGSLLDHSMVVYGSALCDPNRHQHENIFPRCWWDAVAAN